MSQREDTACSVVTSQEDARIRQERDQLLAERQAFLAELAEERAAIRQERLQLHVDRTSMQNVITTNVVNTTAPVVLQHQQAQVITTVRDVREKSPSPRPECPPGSCFQYT